MAQKEYRTKCREDIMHYITSNREKCFSASDIYNYLEGIGSKINITTIYRNLDKLSEGGNLMKFKNSGDDFCVYQYHEPGSGCNEHLHIQCKNCGRICHIDGDFMDGLNEYLSNKCGFTLTCRDSVLIGLCKDCRSTG